MLERHRHRRPGVARRAAAHRVHDEEDGALLLAEHGVDRVRGPRFLDAEARELLAHRLYDSFVIHHWEIPPSLSIIADQCLRCGSICIELTIAFSTPR